jgi:hypothetical protein
MSNASSVRSRSGRPGSTSPDWFLLASRKVSPARCKFNLWKADWRGARMLWPAYQPPVRHRCGGFEVIPRIACIFSIRRLSCGSGCSDRILTTLSAACATALAMGYYRSGRVTISRDVACTELARKLVQLSKEGVRDEGRLSAAGLVHLDQLALKDRKTES